jgi:peptidoglycan/LPS O-acetylase OafA/YrhL
MQPGGWVAFAIVLLTSFSAASVLYFAIERPFLPLRGRLFAGKPSPIATSAVAG